jgi:hypothetical protein
VTGGADPTDYSLSFSCFRAKCTLQRSPPALRHLLAALDAPVVKCRLVWEPIASKIVSMHQREPKIREAKIIARSVHQASEIC